MRQGTPWPHSMHADLEVRIVHGQNAGVMLRWLVRLVLAC